MVWEWCECIKALTASSSSSRASENFSVSFSTFFFTSPADTAELHHLTSTPSHLPRGTVLSRLVMPTHGQGAQALCVSARCMQTP